MAEPARQVERAMEALLDLQGDIYEPCMTENYLHLYARITDCMASHLQGDIREEGDGVLP